MTRKSEGSENRFWFSFWTLAALCCIKHYSLFIFDFSSFSRFNMALFVLPCISCSSPTSGCPRRGRWYDRSVLPWQLLVLHRQFKYSSLSSRALAVFLNFSPLLFSPTLYYLFHLFLLGFCSFSPRTRRLWFWMPGDQFHLQLPATHAVDANGGG